MFTIQWVSQNGNKTNHLHMSDRHDVEMWIRENRPIIGSQFRPRVFKTIESEVTHEFLPDVPVLIGTQVYGGSEFGDLLAECTDVEGAEAALRLLTL